MKPQKGLGQFSRPALSARLRQPLWRRLHRWLGLSVGTLLMLSALSGLALLIGRPLEPVLDPQLFTLPAARSAAVEQPLQAVLTTLQSRYGVNANFTLRLPQQPGETLRVFVRPAAHTAAVASAGATAANAWKGTAFFDPTSAQFLGQRGETEGVLPWLYELHHELLAGDTGKAVLALAGGGFLLLSAAGLLMWWPRRGRPWRHWTDLHHSAGAFTALLLAALVLSGTWMAWRPIGGWVNAALGEQAVVAPKLTVVRAGVGVSGGVNGADTTSPAPAPVSLDTLRARAEAALPEGHTVYVGWRPREALRVRKRLPDDPHPNGLSSVWLDPADGRVLKLVRWHALDSAGRWTAWIYPFHSGQLWGNAQRWVWGSLAAVMVLLWASGAWLWWQRRLGRQRR